jgi:hypothetical protein
MDVKNSKSIKNQIQGYWKTIKKMARKLKHNSAYEEQTNKIHVCRNTNFQAIPAQLCTVCPHSPDMPSCNLQLSGDVLSICSTLSDIVASS